MPSDEVKRRLSMIRQVLERKGFDEIQATHFDNTPARRVVLQDGTGRVARGDDARVGQIIEVSDNLDGLWSALDEAGLVSRL